MRRPRLKAVVLATLALTAMTGLAVASADRSALGISPGGAAGGRRLALTEARAAAGHRVHGVARQGRSGGHMRKPHRGGAGAPAGSPGLVTAAPAPAPSSQPGPAPAPSPDAAPAPPLPPGSPETPTSPEPPASPAAPPAPEPPPSPAPAAPAPAPETTPQPSAPSTPSKSTAAIEPAVPLEPGPAPSGDPSLVLGIDGGYAGWSPAEVRDRTELGAAVTRHEWSVSSPADSEEDQVLAAASEIHTRIHALLGGNELGDPTHYREWVVAFIRYYGPGGTFWREHPQLDASRYAITTIELGNEPYFGGMSAQLYAETVRPTLEEISRLQLPVKVVLPSRVYGSNTSWIDTLYEVIPNLNSLFYAFADHPYWYGHDPAEIGAAGPFGRIETLRHRMNEKGASAKPIFITEYGESTASCGGECVSEAAQAEHLSEMIDAVVSHPGWKVEMLSVFQLLDRGTNSTDRELQFGLLREDGTPKPSYAIVRAAMRLYR